MTPRKESRGVPLSQTSSSLRSRELSSPGPGVSLAAEAEHVEVAESGAALLGEDPTTDLDQGANLEGGPGPGPEEADGVTDQGADQTGEVDQARDTGFTLVTSLKIVARKTWSGYSLSTALSRRS